MMSEHPPSPQSTSSGPPFRELATEAIRYWEPRRLIYNAFLALVVAANFFYLLPGSRKAITFDGVLILFLLGVLANLCYCAAYVADLFVQLSGFRASWIRRRWVLLVIGMAFAGIVTRFLTLGFFSHPTDERVALR